MYFNYKLSYFPFNLFVFWSILSSLNSQLVPKILSAVFLFFFTAEISSWNVFLQYLEKAPHWWGKFSSLQILAPNMTKWRRNLGFNSIEWKGMDQPHPWCNSSEQRYCLCLWSLRLAIWLEQSLSTNIAKYASGTFWEGDERVSFEPCIITHAPCYTHHCLFLEMREKYNLEKTMVTSVMAPFLMLTCCCHLNDSKSNIKLLLTSVYIFLYCIN